VKKTIAWTMLKGVEKLNKYGKDSGNEKSLGKALPHRAEIEQACKDIVYPQQEIVDINKYKKRRDQIAPHKRPSSRQPIQDSQPSLFQDSANPK